MIVTSLFLNMRPMFFGSVLGLGGLANGWRMTSRLWGTPVWIGEALAILAFGLWLLWLVLYVGKWLLFTQEAKAELNHPVQGLAAALVPVATLIASIAIGPHIPFAGWALFIAGAGGVLGYAVWSIGGLWQGGREGQSITPILYLPTVGGGFVSGLACATYGQVTLGWMFFGFGMFSWISMESVFLMRLFQHGLPAGMRATLGVEFAPAVVACVAYLSLSPGPADRFALSLFGYGCFLALILLRLVPWLREQPFGPGAWAYTFGVSALPLAALKLLEQGAGMPVNILAVSSFVAANLIIGWIGVRSLILIVGRR